MIRSTFRICPRVTATTGAPDEGVGNASSQVWAPVMSRQPDGAGAAFRRQPNRNADAGDAGSRDMNDRPDSTAGEGGITVPRLRAPVAFVLSGGASLGAAQVGMLRALDEAAIEPDLLVGTSVGALNAAVCAADPGGCVERLERRWLSMRGLQVFPVNPARLLRSVTAWTSGGLVSSSGLARICREHLHATTFADLAVPLLVVATDQLDGTVVVLDSGSVVDAVLASSAIPGVFPAVPLAGRSLVDGALSANVATLQAVAAGARTVVVLEASGPCRLTRPPRGVVEQVLAAVHVLTRSQAAAQADQAAEEALVLYLPTPCTTRTSPLDFGGSAGLIEAAYELSRDFLAGLPAQPSTTGLLGQPHRHHVGPGDTSVTTGSDTRRRSVGSH